MAVSSKARQKLAAKFLRIAVERIERLNQGLVELEENPGNQGLADEVLREIHTLKGESRMMGFARINRISHKTEELLLLARKLGFDRAAHLNDQVLMGFDAMTALLDEEKAETFEFDDEAFCAAVDKLVETDDKAATEAADASKESSVEEVESAATTESLQKQIGDVRIQRTADTSVRVASDRLDHLTALAGGISLAGSRAERRVETLGSVLDTWRRADVAARTRFDASQKLAGAAALNSTKRLLTDVVEEQRKLVGALEALVNESRDASFDDSMRLIELEESVRALRLVPVSTLFQRFQRAIRDLAREQGKQVRLDISGDDVELDKQVMEHLGEPLLHLVRNCVDHGIENIIERQRADKDPRALVRLSAVRSGTHVDFALEDDGRGLDLAAIRGAAVARGLLSERDAAAADDKELHALIFRAGLSTRESATDISGRGVGLDVVKQRLEALGGSVTVSSTPGKGTAFKLSVPISIALIRVLVISVGDANYAVPAESVVQLVRLREDDVERAGDGYAFRFAGRPIALSDLHLLLGIASAPEYDATAAVAILQHHGQMRGLRVERCLGERQVLQRSLDPFVQALRIISGTALLDEGELVLMLNVPELLRIAEGGGIAMVDVKSDIAPGEIVSRRLLVVDDSELTRDLIVGLLRDRGYQIDEAVDGQEALNRIAANRPDLILTDIDMPVLDGFELLRAVRASEDYRNLPVVMLSTRGADVDKRTALELGADAYMVKSNFQTDDLLRTVARYLGASGS